MNPVLGENFQHIQGGWGQSSVPVGASAQHSTFLPIYPQSFLFWEIQPLKDPVPAYAGFRIRPFRCLKGNRSGIPEQHLNSVGIEAR